MNVRDHMTLEKLEALEKKEPDAYLAKRIRTIILSIKGFTVGDIVLSLGVPYRTVQSWVEYYNKNGSKMFKEHRGGGKREALTEEQQAELKKRIDGGPKAEDDVCTLRGVDVQHILAQEFGVLRKLSSIYVLLHKMGYSYLRPRPRHRKADAEAQVKFIEQLPGTLAAVAAAHPDCCLRIFFQDESRFGQQGSITNVWARRGSRPTAVRQTEYEYLWVLGAACPETGKAEGLLSPRLNTDVVNIFLKQFSATVPDDEHAVIIWDGAGYHKSKSLQKPENITLIQLPAYSPELNPIENLWHYLKSHYLSNRAYADYEALEAAAVESWCQAVLNPDLMKTVCSAPYLNRAGLN
jgi:transposase